MKVFGRERSARTSVTCLRKEAHGVEDEHGVTVGRLVLVRYHDHPRGSGGLSPQRLKDAAGKEVALAFADTHNRVGVRIGGESRLHNRDMEKRYYDAVEELSVSAALQWCELAEVEFFTRHDGSGDRSL